MKATFSICAFLIIFAASVVPANSLAAEPTHLWSKRISGAEGGCVNNCFYPRIVGDHVYLGGYVIGNTDFNNDGDSTDDGEPGDTASSSEDIVFATYDLDGTYSWSMRIGDGTHANESSFGIAASDDGAVYIAGSSDGLTDLNRDGDTLDEGEDVTIGVHGLSDIIIAAYTDTGSSTWAKRLGGQSFDYAFAVDANDDFVVFGGSVLTNNADLSGDGDTDDGGESIGYGLEDGFVSVFSDDGIYQWSKRLGGNHGFVGDIIEDVSIADGKVFVTGSVIGDVDLNGDGDTADLHETGSGGDTSIFLSVFSLGDGSPLWWVRVGPGVGRGVVANTDHVYVVGPVLGNADLSGDGDQLDAGESESGYANGDIFITAFTVDGSYAWSTRLGGQGNDESYAVALDNDNVLYVAGAITGLADLTGDATTTTAAEMGVGFGSNDIFLVSYSATGTPLTDMRLGGTNSEYAEGLAVTDGVLVLTSFLSDDGDLSNDGDLNDEGESISVADGLADMVVTAFLFDYEAPTLSSLAASAPGTSPVVTGNGSDGRSSIASIQYQLNVIEGDWQSCTAADGSFDESSEGFECAPTYPDEGTYMVYIRAADTPGNFTATSAISSIQVEVDSPSSGGGGGGCRSCDEEDEDATDEGENEDPDTGEEEDTKVTLCHNTEITITVAETAAPAHLDHGDSFGPCPGDTVKNLVDQEDQGEAAIEPEDMIVEQFTETINILIKNKVITDELAIDLYTKIINLTAALKERRVADALGASSGVNNMFTSNMNPGDENNDVLRLQKFLNGRGFVIALTGPGSVGNETKYYGEMTKAAVAKFQKAYADEILVPAGLTEATGICGERTRAKINKLIN